MFITLPTMPRDVLQLRMTLLRDDSSQSARDQGSEVGEDPRKGKTSWGSEVGWLPDRIELLLVLAETLEVVEVLTEAVGQGADAHPDGTEGTVLETGERCHAEVEPAVTVLLAPQHELEEHVVHHTGRRIGDVPHQV